MAATLFTAHCLLITAFAAVEQTASVLDGSGGRSSGGTLELVSAAGQPGGVQVSSNGGLVNYAGFLGTFSLQPGLDTDQDGLGDEVDPDNDNDALDDLTELAGNEFDPVTASDPSAIPPWYETEASFDHVGGGSEDDRVYYIRIEE